MSLTDADRHELARLWRHGRHWRIGKTLAPAANRFVDKGLLDKFGLEYRLTTKGKAAIR